MTPRATSGRYGLARLVALASVLQVGESLLPHPIPGIRLGLANVVTLIVLARQGASAGVAVAVLRTLVSSFLLGTFLSPAFLFSFVGAVTSMLVMAALHRLSARSRLPLFSYLGISVAGSAAHLFAQMAVVGLLVPTRALLWFWPYCGLAAVGSGLLTGWVARGAIGRIEQEKIGLAEQEVQGQSCGLESAGAADGCPATEPAPAAVGRTLLGMIPAELKIAVTLVICLVAVLSGQVWLYLMLALALVVVLLVARVPMKRFGPRLARSVPLLAAFGLIPIIFTPWGRRLFTLGPVTVTAAGIHESGRVVLRLGLLHLAATVLMLTTPPAEVAVGLVRLVSRFRRRHSLTRSSPSRLRGHEGLLGVAVMALNEYPEVWRRGLWALRRNRQFGFITMPVEVVAGLVIDAERVGRVDRKSGL